MNKVNKEASHKVSEHTPTPEIWETDGVCVWHADYECFYIYDKETVDYIVNTLNNHSRLLKENGELREALKHKERYMVALKKCEEIGVIVHSGDIQKIVATALKEDK